jgi:uncharacterized protein YqeY
MIGPVDLDRRLEEDATAALRAGDRLRLGVLRRARAAIHTAEVDAGGDLGEAGRRQVLRRLARQHEESIEAFAAGGRDDLVERERAELEVLREYLPAQLDEAAVEAVVREVIAEVGASGPADIGPVMRAAMGRLGEAADGRMVSGVARRVLAG